MNKSPFREASDRFDRYAGALHMKALGLDRMEEELGKIRYSAGMSMSGYLIEQLTRFGFFFEMFLLFVGRGKGLVCGANPEWVPSFAKMKGYNILGIDWNDGHARFASHFLHGNNTIHHDITEKRLSARYGKFRACIIHNRVAQACNAEEMEVCLTNLRHSFRKGAKVIIIAKFIPKRGWEEFGKLTGYVFELLDGNPEQVRIIDKKFKGVVDAANPEETQDYPDDIKAGQRYLHFWKNPQQIAEIGLRTGYKIAYVQVAPDIIVEGMGTFNSGRWPMGFVVLEAS